MNNTRVWSLPAKFYYIKKESIKTNLEFGEGEEKLKRSIHSMLLMTSPSKAGSLFNEYTREYFVKDNDFYTGNGLIFHKNSLVEISVDNYCILLEGRHKQFSLENIISTEKTRRIYEEDESKIAKSHMLMLKQGIKFTKGRPMF